MEQKRIHFQLWLSGDDCVRYGELLAMAKARQPYSKVSDLHRRLLGLDQGQELLTDREVQYFRGLAERPKTITVEKLSVPKKPASKRRPKDDANDDAA